MSGSNQLDFIEHYIPGYAEFSDDGETIRGGYGRKIFNQRGHNQLENVVAILIASKDSRRAVIQLFDAEDIERHYNDVPCTCTLQFMARRRKLHMIATMRSNDAYKGLPHDIFCFTMLQEIISRRLGIDVGNYKHFVGSMHLYEKDVELASQYLEEGVQPTIPMPEMPSGDPRPAISRVLDAEVRIRLKLRSDPDTSNLPPYWADIVRLLQVLDATGDADRIEAIKSQISFSKYIPYIDNRKMMRPREVGPGPKQLSFLFI